MNGNCSNYLIFFIFKIGKIRDSSFIAHLILRHGIYKTIDRSFKIVPVVVFPVSSCFWSTLAEHDVTFKSFVADLSYHGLSNFNIMCEIDAEGAGSSAVIPPLVYNMSQENERAPLSFSSIAPPPPPSGARVKLRHIRVDELGGQWPK